LVWTIAIFCITCVGGKAAAQVINMSHDLVTLGIASQNLTPNDPSLDSRPLIQAAINYAQTHTVQTLTVDQGAYYLLSETQSNAILIFPGLSNMTVDLAGSTIYFTGPFLPNGIQVYQCSNFILKNFSTDFITPPYTHVQLTSIDSANRVLHYQTLPGWPDPSTFNNLASPFGDQVSLWTALFRSGAIVPGTTRTILTGPIEGNTLTLFQDGAPWTQSATLSTLQPGDTAVVTARASGPPILIWVSDSVTLSNVNVYGSPQWAVELYSTSNTTVDGVRVMPRPGVGLIGSNADGIHFTSLRQNNTLQNSYVTRTMDDALIMESLWAGTVVSQNSPTQLTVTRSGYLRFPNGTSVNFNDPVTTAESTGATIISQSPPDSPGPAYNGQVVLTFNRALPALTPGTGMVYADPNLRGQGSIIQDNLVEDTYGGRGIWLSGVEGVTARRNVMRRTSMAGIIASQDTEAYPGPPSRNVTITDNALEADLGPAAPGSGIETALGAVQVESTNNQQFSFASNPSNSNFSILNNYIADSGMSGIWAGELNGGTIQNNLVIRYSQDTGLGGLYGVPPPFPSMVSADSKLPIAVEFSSNITKQNNTTSSSSPITAPVTFSASSNGFDPAGGTGSFSFTTAVSGFNWRAVSSPWITITSATSGFGPSTLTYTVATNPSGLPRSGSIVIAGEAFTVYQAGGPLQFVPVTPCRLVDTRKVYGGNGPIQGGSFETFNLPQLAQSKGCAGLSSAAAYSLNFTVVPQGGLGYLTVWPAAQSEPLVSTLNSYDGRVKAVAAIVPAGASSSVSVYVTNTTDVVIDIDGYFTTPSQQTLQFYPLPPCRVADTRDNSKPQGLGTPYLKGGVARAFPVLNAASCNIPSSAQAYSMNFTAVPHATLGYLTVWPTGKSQPVVSTLNSYGGQYTANAAIVPVGTNGNISTYASNDTDLVIDINGYFAPPGTGGLSLYSVAPCRVLDTRVPYGGNGSFRGTLSRPVDPVSSACAVPGAAQAYVINATVVPTGGLGYLTLWPDGGTMTLVSTLNALDGIVTSNMAIVPAGNQNKIDAYAEIDTSPTDLILDVSGYFAP
jgi:hypothetical protein